jgi:uncharacterized repeat protein (TIGR01451 family)
MLSSEGRRGFARTIAGFSAASVVTAAVGLIVLLAPSALAAGLCATPGGSGPGGTLSGVVNTYYPGVGSVPAGATVIAVGGPSGAATPIASGDLLLVIQMQDADFDSANTNSYGHGGAPAVPASGLTSLNSTGLYEYVRATSGVVAGSVHVSGLGSGGGLINSYVSAAATGTAGQRTFQLIRVPQYTTATTSSALTASAWNGSVGGVLAIDASQTLTLSGTTSVDGLGFRPGLGLNRTGGTGMSDTDVAVSATAGSGGTKGEGVAGTPSNTTASNGYPGGDAARGAPGNAGGGGTDANPAANDQNSGGGGGGNGGAGGEGGDSWFSGLAVGGYGGVAMPATPGRVFMGGGGGSGTSNNENPPASDGAAGGGIVLIRAGSVAGSGSITANGADAYNLTANDGGGGGGGGGTAVLTTTTGSLSGATLDANGGAGGDAWATQPGAGNAHGPGGGGGGGWIMTSSAPGGATVTGGAHGTTTSGALTYGSFAGSAGRTATAAPSTVPGVSGGAQCADLSVTKSGPASVVAGSSVHYAVTVANAGPGTALAVKVVDTLPFGVTFVSASGTGWACTHAGNTSVTCTRGSLASGATAPAIAVVVTAPATATRLTNSATVSAASPDPQAANNTSSVTTTVTAASSPGDTSPGGTTLPRTGTSEIGLVSAAGLAMVALGGLLLAAAAAKPSWAWTARSSAPTRSGTED